MTFHFTVLITRHLPVPGKLRGKCVVFPWDADSRQAFWEAFHDLPAGGSAAPHSRTPFPFHHPLGVMLCSGDFPFLDLRTLPNRFLLTVNTSHPHPRAKPTYMPGFLLLSPKGGFP